MVLGLGRGTLTEVVMCGLCWHVGYEVPRSETEPTSHELQGRSLTTGPEGKSPDFTTIGE